jgi:hypothetical protein
MGRDVRVEQVTYSKCPSNLWMMNLPRLNKNNLVRFSVQGVFRCAGMYIRCKESGACHSSAHEM